MNIRLTVEELAKSFKIKPQSIYKKVRLGERQAAKLGKMVKVRGEALDQWLMKEMKATMKEVRAARQVVEARVEEAVTEVRKRARAASQVVINEVPGMLDDLKSAPLNKKQASLTRSLKSLWNGLSNGSASHTSSRSTSSKTKKRSHSKSKSSMHRSNGHRSSASTSHSSASASA